MPHCILKLKNELRANLDRTWSAGTDSRICCCDVRRCTSTAEASGGWIVQAESILSTIGICEVRMVEDVEEFHAELQPHGLSNVKILGDREIKVLEAGILEH